MKAADIARAAFEKLIELITKEALESIDPNKPIADALRKLDSTVTELRRAFDQALIVLRFDVMDTQVAMLELQAQQAKRDAAEAYRRGQEIGAGLDVTVIDPHTGEPEKKE